MYGKHADDPPNENVTHENMQNPEVLYWNKYNSWSCRTKKIEEHKREQERLLEDLKMQR